MHSIAEGGYSIFHKTMADMTYPEVVTAARNGAVVLWGLGVIEQHGPHLPLATDVYLPYALLRQAGDILDDRGIPSVLMPPFYWGVNHVTGLFPGTFEVRPEIMIELMIDLIKSLDKDGFKFLFCISGHGDPLHNRSIFQALKRGREESRVSTHFVCTPPFLNRLKTHPDFDPADPVIIPAREVDRKTAFVDIHAGEIESSSMWGLFPDLVRTEVLPSLKSTDFGPADLAEWREGREQALRKTPNGYLGDPAKADPEVGRKNTAEQAALLADAIEARLKN